MIKAYINRKKARLLVDSGASKSVFDTKRMQEFSIAKKKSQPHKLSTGLGTNSMKSHVSVLKNLRIGELVLKEYSAVLLDLSHVNHSYTSIGLEPIDGVIGNDILTWADAIIDYKKMELKLRIKETKFTK